MQNLKELLTLCNTAKYVEQNPRLTILPLQKIQSVEMRLHQAMGTKKVFEDSYYPLNEASSHGDITPFSQLEQIDEEIDLHHYPHLREVIRLKSNKGLTADEKLYHMQSVLTKLSDSMNRIMLSI